MENDRYLTFALTKGRLADKTLKLLNQVGITCEEMLDKETRKLIFVNEELKLKFFLYFSNIFSFDIFIFLILRLFILFC